MSNQTQPERWAYFDCFAGLSGDMTLGAMLDAGLDRAALESVLQSSFCRARSGGYSKLSLRRNSMARWA